jgi:hypothetical protein
MVYFIIIKNTENKYLQALFGAKHRPKQRIARR